MENSIQNWKVLVADNSALMCRLIKKYLVEMGLKVENITLAGDGNQAAMMTDLMSFDLVTAGRHMRSKDGLELLKGIRANPDDSVNKVKFLVISADGSPQLVADILSAGANGLLNKPFHPQDLSETISRLTNGNSGFVCLKDSERCSQKIEYLKEASFSAEESVKGVPQELIDVFVQSTVEGLGQYMVQAQPGSRCDDAKVKGDLASSIDLTDPKFGMKFVLTLLFPKKGACTIYETLFGEVDMEMVCGIVGELNNIIGGAVKPYLTGMAKTCHDLIPSDSVSVEDVSELELQLGFPESKWLAEDELGLPEGEGVRFSVPFQLDEGQLYLSVALQPIES